MMFARKRQGVQRELVDGLICMVMLQLFLCDLVLAEVVSPVEQMARLNAMGRAPEAYQLGRKHLLEYEGEPAFDLLYGVAAVDSGYVSEGIFALERVIMVQPDNHYARLELGRAYFVLEEYARAKSEFQMVLRAEPTPPEEVTEKVDVYLTAIQSLTAWRETSLIANLEFSGGYDSNILASPEDDTFFVPLLNGNARIGSTAESDTFWQARANATVSHPVRYGANLFLTGHASHRSNNSDQLDLTHYGAQSGLLLRQDAHTLRLALQANVLEVDARNFRDSVGGIATWRYRLSPQAQVSLNAQVNQFSYKDLEFRDSMLVMGGVGVGYQFIAPLRPALNFSFSYGEEDADNDELSGALQNTERDIVLFSTSLNLSLTSNLALTAGFNYEDSQYAAEEALFQTVRNDKQYRASLRLAWTPMNDLIVMLDGSFNKRDSNIPIVEYEREQLSLSMRYSYH